jgi:hypothetical protein
MSDIVELLVDESDLSRRAAELFDYAAIPYRRFYGHGLRLPSASYLGVSYPEFRDIIALVSWLKGPDVVERWSIRV